MDRVVARRNMVNSQIRTSRVTDERVIQAFLAVPRELFVPAALQGVAYVDEDVALGGGRYLTEPVVLARMIDALAVDPADVVLVVGCASGYSAAVLSRLANTVVAVESDSRLAGMAAASFRELGIDNVVLLEGPLRNGDRRHSPYQAILVDGAVDELPASLTEQIGGGGRLVAVVGRHAPGRVVLMTQQEGRLSSRILFDASIGLLPEFAQELEFAL